MRLYLMALACALSLLFTSLWAVTFISEDFIVITSRWLIVKQVEQSVDSALEVLPQAVRQHVGATSEQRTQIKTQLRHRLEGLRVKKTFWAQGSVANTLYRLAEQKYQQTLEQLRRDVRIFSFSNSVLFLLVALAAWRSEGRRRTLFMPAVLLLVSTGYLTFCYVFKQNWLYTLLFNDYFGWLYLFWVTLLFLFLCDVAFNKCRVTRTLTEAMSSF